MHVHFKKAPDCKKEEVLYKLYRAAYCSVKQAK